MGLKLLDATDVDVVGTAVELPSPGNVWKNLDMAVYCWGTAFGGGTVRLEISPDNVNWFTARTRNDNQVLFTQGDMVVAVMRGARYARARLDGAVGANDVSLVLY